MTRATRIIKTARCYEPAMSEEGVLGQIRGLLEANGARIHRVVERIPWGRKRSEAGIPDLFGWFPMGWPVFRPDHLFMMKLTKPIVFFIEVKKPGGHLRPMQATWIAQAQADGVIAFKAESWEECKAHFAESDIFMKVG